jgi:hypothetical protein
LRRGERKKEEGEGRGQRIGYEARWEGYAGRDRKGGQG